MARILILKTSEIMKHPNLPLDAEYWMARTCRVCGTSIPYSKREEAVYRDVSATNWAAKFSYRQHTQPPGFVDGVCEDCFLKELSFEMTPRL